MRFGTGRSFPHGTVYPASIPYLTRYSADNTGCNMRKGYAVNSTYPSPLSSGKHPGTRSIPEKNLPSPRSGHYTSLRSKSPVFPGRHFGSPGTRPQTCRGDREKNRRDIGKRICLGNDRLRTFRAFVQERAEPDSRLLLLRERHGVLSGMPLIFSLIP